MMQKIQSPPSYPVSTKNLVVDSKIFDKAEIVSFADSCGWAVAEHSNRRHKPPHPSSQNMFDSTWLPKLVACVSGTAYGSVSDSC